LVKLRVPPAKAWTLFAAASVVAVTGWGLASYRDFSKSLIQYHGIAIGAAREEVLYRLGLPTVVSDGQRLYIVDEESGGPNAIPPSKSIGNYSEWSYESSDKPTLRFTFDSGSAVLSVTCFESQKKFQCEPLARVRVSDSEESIVRRLGRPNKMLYDGLFKEMRFDDLGVKFSLMKGRVSSVEKYKPYLHGPNRLCRFVGIRCSGAGVATNLDKSAPE